MRVWSRLRDSLERHGRAAMVTVVSAKGSTPREAGARLIVHPDGRFTGTIGGGTLEWRAIALAQAALAERAAPDFQLRRFALGPELGQCCGGRVDLALEVFESGKTGELSALVEAETAGNFTTLARSEGGRMVRRVTLHRDVPAGSAEWNHGTLTEGFGETVRPLLLFGAGHVGRALTLALAPLPFAVTWVDSRPDVFPAHVPANVTLRQIENPVDAIATAPASAFALVLTHSHSLDLEIVHRALVDGRFAYVGLIGSTTKRARFEKRLAEMGVDRVRIEELACPIGVGGIRSKLPAVIAAATAAELLIRDEALRAAANTVSEEVTGEKRGRGGTR
jgi:xanthine dehydrogenase accessory factor